MRIVAYILPFFGAKYAILYATSNENMFLCFLGVINTIDIFKDIFPQG